MPLPTINDAKFLKVDEKIETQRGRPFSSAYVRNYTRIFLVVTDDRELGASYVCGAPGVPRPYSIYQTADGQEYDLFAVLVDYDVSRLVVDGHYHWTVVCNYSTEVPEEGIPDDVGFETEIGRETFGPHNEPWLRPAVWHWEWEETTHAPATDLDGRAYLNSARQPFSPPPTFPIARSILVVIQNEQNFDRTIAELYNYAVNADVFLDADPGTAQCLPIKSEPRNLGPLRYYRNTYRIRFGLPKPADPYALDALLPWDGIDKETEDNVLTLQSFQPRILDQGFCRLQQVGPHIDRPVPIFRPGNSITQPALLNGNGQEVTPDGNGRLVPYFIPFRQYHSRFFAPIIEGGVF